MGFVGVVVGVIIGVYIGFLISSLPVLWGYEGMSRLSIVAYFVMGGALVGGICGAGFLRIGLALGAVLLTWAAGFTVLDSVQHARRERERVYPVPVRGPSDAPDGFGAADSSQGGHAFEMDPYSTGQRSVSDSSDGRLHTNERALEAGP